MEAPPPVGRVIAGPLGSPSLGVPTTGSRIDATDSPGTGSPMARSRTVAVSAGLNRAGRCTGQSVTGVSIRTTRVPTFHRVPPG